MEKFGKWRDKESGVGPFLPRTAPESSVITFFRWVFGIVKLPLFLVLQLVSFILLSIARFIPIRILGRLLERLISFVFYQQTLFLFGQYFTKVTLTPLIKRLVEGSWEKPGNGDVVFTHCTSYLNLFWLQFKLCPTFIVPVSEENCNVLSIHSLVFRLLTHKDLRETKNPKKIEDVIRDARKHRKGPVVVLAEGAPTNSEGLLMFQCFNAELEEDTRIHVLGFSRPFKGCSPNLTATNGLAHLIRQLGKFYTKCEVKAALEADVGHPANDKITKEFVEKEREVLSRLTKIPTTALDANSFNEFMDFYNKSKHLPKLKNE